MNKMKDTVQTEEFRQQIERERIAGLKQEEKDKETLRRLEETLLALRNAKPSERGEMARRYAVTITDFEKVMAYFKVYVVDSGNDT